MDCRSRRSAMVTVRHRWETASRLTSRGAGKENILQSKVSAEPEALPGGAFETGSAALRPQTAEDFEAALSRAESGGADLLQIWTDYVLWAQRWPSAEKVVLLRRAVRSLSVEKLYNQDIRLLRLWVMLADKESSPTNIFRQLEDRGIGTHHALLYEAWAHCLETRRDFEAAAEVYRRGLRSSAEPQARLRARRADFDERMRQRVTRLAARRSEPGRLAPQSPRRSTHFRLRTSLLNLKPSRPHTSELRARLSPQKRQERRRSIMERRRRSVLLRPKPRLPKEPARADAATFRRTRATPPVNEVAVQSTRPSRRQLRSGAPTHIAPVQEDSGYPGRLTCRNEVAKEAEHIRKRPLEAVMRSVAEEASGGEADWALPIRFPPQEPGVYSRLAAEAGMDEPKELEARHYAQVLVKAAPRRGILGAWLAPWTSMFQQDDEEDTACEVTEAEDLRPSSEQLCLEQTPAKRRKRAWFGW
mmetsp:Transcript_122272/g.172027  ORF Transcript_122272/g.172027 Transcript_122272/m.172027 type:complete len:474 (-) Transcript_122272:211-1632(-)